MGTGGGGGRSPPTDSLPPLSSPKRRYRLVFIENSTSAGLLPARSRLRGRAEGRRSAGGGFLRQARGRCLHRGAASRRAPGPLRAPHQQHLWRAREAAACSELPAGYLGSDPASREQLPAAMGNALLPGQRSPRCPARCTAHPGPIQGIAPTRGEESPRMAQCLPTALCGPHPWHTCPPLLVVW